ncbi:MAG: hypothetical protein EB015_13965 [Methylocystaceae bacterium]|nr:hypothetical protein [Methylocystaceae bacterium]
MLTQQEIYVRELKKLLEERIKNTTDTLINKWAVDDYPAYRHYVGLIEGLKTSIELCDEAETECKRKGLIG